MQPDSQFLAASQSKIFTCMALLSSQHSLHCAVLTSHVLIGALLAMWVHFMKTFTIIS